MAKHSMVEGGRSVSWFRGKERVVLFASGSSSLGCWRDSIMRMSWNLASRLTAAPTGMVEYLSIAHRDANVPLRI